MLETITCVLVLIGLALFLVGMYKVGKALNDERKEMNNDDT